MTRADQLAAAGHLGDGGGGVYGPAAREYHRRRVGGVARNVSAVRDDVEVGVHRRGRLVALGWILCERTQDDEVEIGRDVASPLRRSIRDLGQVLHRDLDRRFAREGDVAGQELEEDDAGRVEVRRLVDWGTARLLG